MDIKITNTQIETDSNVIKVIKFVDVSIEKDQIAVVVNNMRKVFIGKDDNLYINGALATGTLADKVKSFPDDFFVEAPGEGGDLIESAQDIIDAITVNRVLDTEEQSGYYIRLSNGSKQTNAGFKIVDWYISHSTTYYLTTTIVGGADVALVAYYNGSIFIGYQEKGTNSSTVSYNDLELIIPNNATKLTITTNANQNISLSVKELQPASKQYVDSKKTPTSIQTWGDSITEANKYQPGIKSRLGITDVKNFGLSSDFSMHVRRRFLSYFEDETPYKGTATYNVPSLQMRQSELKDSFFVIWMGTNNLINSDRASGSLTTGSEDYTNLQPSPQFKFDRLYARSYLDTMLCDIREITKIIPHGNFAIIGGHGGFASDGYMRDKMLELDAILSRMYPRNFIDVRELVIMDYDYLNTFVSESFVKPALSGSISITVTDASWVTAGLDICVGTKEIFDKYHVDSIDGNTVTATLLESGTEFSEGDTIESEYLLVSDLGRDAVGIRTAVYSYDDVNAFSLKSFPRSSSTPIHFTDAQYNRIGQLIGNEIVKINR